MLRHRTVRRFYAGYVPSKLGTAMASIALAFAVLDSGGSAADLGYVFAAQIVPQVLLMLGGGVVADRLGRRPVMLGADLLRTTSQGVLAALLFAGHPSIWVFALLAGAVGVGDALFGPAFNALTVENAPSDELGDANALFGMTQSGVSVVGPALAGALVALANPATVVALDAASYGLSALALAGLKLPRSQGTAGSSVWRDLMEGWGEFKSRTWLWVTTLQFAPFNLVAWGPFLLLGPVLSKAYLGGAQAWGIIMAGYGAGSVAGGLVALGRRPGRPLLIAIASTFGYPLPLALLAFGLPTPEVAAGAVVAGLGSAGVQHLLVCFRPAASAQGGPGRVYAFVLVGAYSAGPIAYAGAGPVALLVGAHLVLAFGAAWAVLASLVVVGLPAIRWVHWRIAVDEPSEPQAPHSDAG
ncbi:MAG: MFS transporter [Acidimicrobiales bacterium]